MPCAAARRSASPRPRAGAPARPDRSSTPNATWCMPSPRRARNAPDRGVVRERREELDAARARAAARSRRTPCDATPSRGLDLGAEQPLVARARRVEVAHRDADVVDAERGHAGSCHGPRSRQQRCDHARAIPLGGGGHGPIRQGQGEGDGGPRAGQGSRSGAAAEAAAQEARGRRRRGATPRSAHAAFTLFEAGTLSLAADLDAAAERVRDARAAVEAKKAEITSAAGDDADGDDEADSTASSEVQLVPKARGAHRATRHALTRRLVRAHALHVVQHRRRRSRGRASRAPAAGSRGARARRGARSSSRIASA